MRSPVINRLFQPSAKHYFPNHIAHRLASSAPGPRNYTSNELNDLNELLEHAIKSVGGDHGERALADLAKTPFAPRDWWQETYARSLRRLPELNRSMVETIMSTNVYIFRRRKFSAEWTPATLVDVKQKLWLDFIASVAAFAILDLFVAFLVTTIIWTYREKLLPPGPAEFEESHPKD